MAIPQGHSVIPPIIHPSLQATQLEPLIFSPPQSHMPSPINENGYPIYTLSYPDLPNFESLSTNAGTYPIDEVLAVIQNEISQSSFSTFDHPMEEENSWSM
ncbi:uncharacterized protein PAF06_006259 [Gastrophryne carolinensis]